MSVIPIGPSSWSPGRLRASSLLRLLGVDRWATFDCYGTLIDWNAGIRTALAGDLARRGPRGIARFLPRGRARSRGRRDALVPRGPDAGGRRSRSGRGSSPRRTAPVPRWPTPCRRGGPSPRCRRRSGRLREDGWRLAILSNTDADYLDASLSSIGVPVDERVVASDIGSYKPAFAHWETFFRRTGADRRRPRPRGRLVCSTTSSPPRRSGSRACGSTGSASRARSRRRGAPRPVGAARDARAARARGLMARRLTVPPRRRDGVVSDHAELPRLR